ncbi:MAG: membrane protein insertase YidC [Candidatus Omnitrophica bacterium]|nr:membrane protein insertase YidC [Candidatus Omnitrophota bacterium]
MERRLFLAIGLSMLVVWLYSINSPKTRPSSLSEVTEPFANVDVTRIANKTKEQKSLTGLSGNQPDTVQKVMEEINVLESNKLSIETSNIGAALNKIWIKEYDATLPLEGITTIAGYDNVNFVSQKNDDYSIQYTFEDNYTIIIKNYMINDENYTIKSEIRFQNKRDMSKLVKVKIKSFIIRMSNLDKKENTLNKSEMRDKSLNEYVVHSESGIYRKAGAFKFGTREKRDVSENVVWSGFRNRYYCLLLKPQYETSGYDIIPVEDNSLEIDIVAKEANVPANGNVQFDSIIYAGPEKVEILEKYGLGFERITRYYKFGLFDGIAKIIASLMRLLYKVIPNWGICIILISIIIYFSMYPLTMRSMLSMKKMQALQPMIVKLKEKHKDNPQKMNKEMMELYKENKVNPLGGCLPMLLQMPVFIGLYQVLWRSVAFKGAKFLWMKDLSQPDRLFIFPVSLPIIGNEFNLLPLIMVAVMFVQQKLSSKNMIVTDPNQASQQKMMAIIMPIFLGFIFYKFASGLTLYFTMFYFFSTFTQWKLSKSVKAD